MASGDLPPVIELQDHGGGSAVRKLGRQPPDGKEEYVVSSKHTLVRQDSDGIVEMEDFVGGSTSFRFTV
jgi:hypothetical protein